jgi:hypothetical protein
VDTIDIHSKHETHPLLGLEPLRSFPPWPTGLGAARRYAEPKPRYDAIIVGGGGHGLATAYYLARDHGMHRMRLWWSAGWIGGGNTGRNTTIVRSQLPLVPESCAAVREFDWR